jgi:hypothetical protein
MTNEKRIILLTGALIVAALWFRAAAEYVNPTGDVTETAIAEVISHDPLSSEAIQAALIPTNELSKICTNAEGSPVRCSEISEDAICIQRPVGAHSGTRIDCNTGEPIPANAIDAQGQGGAKYRSPY